MFQRPRDPGLSGLENVVIVVIPDTPVDRVPAVVLIESNSHDFEELRSHSAMTNREGWMRRFGVRCRNALQFNGGIFPQISS